MFREKGRGEYNACNNHAQINSHTGLTQLIEGSVAAWLVKFQLDGDNSINAAVSIPLAGPPTHREAQEKAFKILQVFLNDAAEAATKFRFSD